MHRIDRQKASINVAQLAKTNIPLRWGVLLLSAFCWPWSCLAGPYMHTISSNLNKSNLVKGLFVKCHIKSVTQMRMQCIFNLYIQQRTPNKEQVILLLSSTICHLCCRCQPTLSECLQTYTVWEHSEHRSMRVSVHRVCGVSQMWYELVLPPGHGPDVNT